MYESLPLFDDEATTPQSTDNVEGIIGLRYWKNFLNSMEQASLLQRIDDQPWTNDLSRRVQHYGFKYDYKARRVDLSMFVGPLPQFVSELAERLAFLGLVPEIPDQVIVNEYLPGQGITPHIDCEPCFADYIVTVSLGAVYWMTFQDTRSEQTREFPLGLGSATVMSGEARYRWKHGIKSRKSDHGKLRGRRVSVTFRKVVINPPSGAGP